MISDSAMKYKHWPELRCQQGPCELEQSRGCGCLVTKLRDDGSHPKPVLPRILAHGKLEELLTAYFFNPLVAWKFNIILSRSLAWRLAG